MKEHDENSEYIKDDDVEFEDFLDDYTHNENHFHDFMLRISIKKVKIAVNLTVLTIVVLIILFSYLNHAYHTLK